jgi:hypothetical protein
VTRRTPTRTRRLRDPEAYLLPEGRGDDREVVGWLLGGARRRLHRRLRDFDLGLGVELEVRRAAIARVDDV